MTQDSLLHSELLPGQHGAVEVRNLSGKMIASLAIESPKETVGTLRHRLIKAVTDEDLRRRYGQSWLVCGCDVLPDHRPLSNCVSSGSTLSSEPIALTLVCARPSSLAEHLSQSGLESDGLLDVADGVFQAEHKISVRHQPKAQGVANNLSPDIRAQVVDWLAIACNAVGFDDQILHGAVLTLDRFCAVQKKPIDESQLLLLSLAVLCTEMKLAPVDEFPCGTWQRLLLHLGQGREGLPAIFATEAEVLRQLGFNVWVPTALTFLRGLSLRLCQGPGTQLADGPAGPVSPAAALQLSFAWFFVDLALYDIFLQYRFPPSILAAAALGAAQFATGSWSAAAHDTLMEDLASYCPDLLEARGLARECELAILEMWQDCSHGTSRLADCYVHLRERHSRPRQEDSAVCRFGDHLQAASPQTALHSFHAATGPHSFHAVTGC